MESKKLNADAPVFVPSFALKQKPAKQKVQEKDVKETKRNPKQRLRENRSRNKQDKTNNNQARHHDENTNGPDRQRKNRREGRQRRVRKDDRYDSLRSSVSRKNRQRNQRKMASPPTDPVDEHPKETAMLFESSFPPLSQSYETQKIETQHEATSGWSNVAIQGHDQAQRREHDERVRSDEERKLLENPYSKLVPLSQEKPSAPKASMLNVADETDYQSETNIPRSVPDGNEGATDSHKDDSLLAPPIPQLQTTQRRLDMNKMRDRWWDVLRNKKIKEAEVTTLTRTQLLSSAVADNHESQNGDTTESESMFSEDSSDQDEEEASMNKTMESYKDTEHPLHRAIIDGDEEAVRRLLASPTETMFVPVPIHQLFTNSDNPRRLASRNSFAPLHLAVYLDRPRLVKLLVVDRQPKDKANEQDDGDITPLMLAAELGRDGCMRALLSFGSSSIASLAARDNTRGETALHHACRSGSPASTIRLMLNSIASSGGQSQKVLMIRNNAGQIPVHLACEMGYTHIVEVFLQVCSTSILSKMLRAQDSQKQTPLLAAVGVECTDVVMTLLMWSGNHRAGRPAKPGPHGSVAKQDKEQTPCPLSWAVSSGSLEMVHLLLEFNCYDLNAALGAALRSSHDNRHEILRVLVESGANPCLASSEADSNSALSVGALRGDSDSLTAMIDTFQQKRKETQAARLQNHRLQRQPPSYFRTIETREAAELESALNDALVKALFFSWRNGDNKTQCLATSVVLLKKGALLHATGYSRLRSSIQTGTLKGDDEVSAQDPVYLYETDIVHHGNHNGNKRLKISTYDRTPLNAWSLTMMQMDWFSLEDETECSWLLSERHNHGARVHSIGPSSDSVVIVAEDIRFVVHSSIVSQKSAKLAAAIRFATMSSHEDDGNGKDTPMPEVHVGISSRLCRWLLEHIYHGSVVGGWGTHCCNDIFELALVGEEFLCPTLLLECEMRLLASNPYQCFCWSCCAAVRQVDSSSPAQCLLQVRGPSRLLDGDTALDALAVSQQLGETQDYRIKFHGSSAALLSTGATRTWRRYDENAKIIVTPFTAVKEAAIRAMLLDFPAVLKSPSYMTQINEMTDPNEGFTIAQERDAQVMVLQMCLEELESSEIMRLELASRHQGLMGTASRTGDNNK